MKPQRSVTLTAAELLLVQDAIFDKGLSKVDIAKQASLSRQTVHVFLKGCPVDLGSAIKICEMLGVRLFEPNSRIEQECSNCKYWEKEGIDMGRCRRYPPQIYGLPTGENFSVQNLVDFTYFPCTPCVQWCGEFRPNTFLLNRTDDENS